MTNAKITPKAMIGDIPVYCSHDALVDIMKVIPNPKNPNTHPGKQIEILSKIIKAQGWRKPITVSNRSGFVVAGHGRLQAALMLNLEQVPVDYQDYANEAEEHADLVADNRIAELSEIDHDALDALLDELKEYEDFDFELTGYDLKAFGELLEEESQGYEYHYDPSPPLMPPGAAVTSQPTDSVQTPHEQLLEDIRRKQEQTGEISLNDYAEERYAHECPKCKFKW